MPRFCEKFLRLYEPLICCQGLPSAAAAAAGGPAKCLSLQLGALSVALQTRRVCMQKGLGMMLLQKALQRQDIKIEEKQLINGMLSQVLLLLLPARHALCMPASSRSSKGCCSNCSGSEVLVVTNDADAAAAVAVAAAADLPYLAHDAVSPLSLRSIIGSLHAEFATSRQQDAGEDTAISPVVGAAFALAASLVWMPLKLPARMVKLKAMSEMLLLVRLQKSFCLCFFLGSVTERVETEDRCSSSGSSCSWGRTLPFPPLLLHLGLRMKH